MTPPVMVSRLPSWVVESTARRWDGTAVCSPPTAPRYRNGKRRPHSLATVLAVLRQIRRQRRPTPVMHGLVAADERRFADLCHVITLVRPGAGQ
nr:hypothetical protein [Streptomyces incarnatus]